jgi:hypothetical protein
MILLKMLDNSMFGSRVTERTSFFFHVSLPCQIPQVIFGAILRLDPRERFTQENNPTARCFANPGIVHGLNILNPRSAEMVSSAIMLGTNAGRHKAVQRCPSPSALRLYSATEISGFASNDAGTNSGRSLRFTLVSRCSRHLALGPITPILTGGTVRSRPR